MDITDTLLREYVLLWNAGATKADLSDMKGRLRQQILHAAELVTVTQEPTEGLDEPQDFLLWDGLAFLALHVPEVQIVGLPAVVSREVTRLDDEDFAILIDEGGDADTAAGILSDHR